MLYLFLYYNTIYMYVIAGRPGFTLQLFFSNKKKKLY